MLYQAMAENYDIQLLPLQYQLPPMFLFLQPPLSFLLAICNESRHDKSFTILVKE